MDKKKEYQKEYRKLNLEKFRKYSWDYYNKNKDKIKEKKMVYREKHRKENTEKDREYQKKYRNENREHINKLQLESYHRNKKLKYSTLDRELKRIKSKERKKEYKKEYHKKNKNKIKLIKMKWDSENKERNRIYKIEYYYRVIKNNIQLRLKNALSSRMRQAIKYKYDTTLNLTSCSINQLLDYIESQFDDEMSWSNYGKYGWHIDHIIPCDSFDLTKEKEQRKCFNYTNLQPLWAKDNWSKGTKEWT